MAFEIHNNLEKFLERLEPNMPQLMEVKKKDGMMLLKYVLDNDLQCK